MEWSAALSYVFSVVGSSRCDVRAACSGATPSNASVAWIFVPPATTRAGTAQRAIPTMRSGVVFAPHKPGHSLRPRADVKFLSHIGIDRPHANAEFVSDLFGPMALGQEPQDFFFTRR